MVKAPAAAGATSRRRRRWAARRQHSWTRERRSLDGQHATALVHFRQKLKKNGAHYKKNLIPFTSHVEVDGQLITGQNPQSARAVGEALVERLRSGRA
jgi:putative intracellular protease/amidase